jgi:hypothetical protein
MKCNDVLDMVYESGSSLSLGKRLALAFHIIFCGHCAAHLGNYEKARSLLMNDFFPRSPDYSDSIMNSIYQENFDEVSDEQLLGAGGFSIKGWVIAGIVLLLSLATVFFGQEYTNIILDDGSSYLLAMGIITGIVITGYGALFIGSHLKELSERFKLKY